MRYLNNYVTLMYTLCLKSISKHVSTDGYVSNKLKNQHFIKEV